MDQIEVKKLGKKYKRYKSQWRRLADWLTNGRLGKPELCWALKDINFNIQSGESVGIVGLNGAGKSTLLKILTGTTHPDEGAINVHGRVAALLELGLGFHPEFTGRENALLTCRMLGLSAQDSQAIFPQIEAFSELGDFMDQPMRVYSTGMQMRLAFSAATAVQPDIFIIDEALSVGDAYFQHKCIQRVRSFKDNGVTILFVSHDPGAVKSICGRALLLDKGKLLKEGSPDSVLDFYNAMIAKKRLDDEIKQIETEIGTTITRSGDGRAKIKSVEMIEDGGEAARAFSVGDAVKIRCLIRFNAHIKTPTVGFLIRDRLGNDVFGTNTFQVQTKKHAFKAGEIGLFEFSVKLNLGAGNYSLSVAVHSGHVHLEDNYDWWDQCIVFQILPDSVNTFIGCAALPVQAAIHKDLRKE